MRVEKLLKIEGLLVEIPKKSLHFTFYPLSITIIVVVPVVFVVVTVLVVVPESALLFKTGIDTKRKAIAAIPTPSIFIVLVDFTDLTQLCL
jgi:hypothetical protein